MKLKLETLNKLRLLDAIYTLLILVVVVITAIMIIFKHYEEPSLKSLMFWGALLALISFTRISEFESTRKLTGREKDIELQEANIKLVFFDIVSDCIIATSFLGKTIKPFLSSSIADSHVYTSTLTVLSILASITIVYTLILTFKPTKH